MKGIRVRRIVYGLLAQHLIYNNVGAVNRKNENTSPFGVGGLSRAQIWRQHLAPVCSSAWLKDVETYHVQGWLDCIARSANRPLSVSTLRHCKFTLSGLFRLAAQQGYRTGSNPVEATAVSPMAARQKQTYAYTIDEISRLLGLLEEPALTIIAVCAFTGLRIGEVEGLQWEDWCDGCLHVSRSIWRGHISPPKTQESAAPVPVIRPLANMLEMHRARSGFPSCGPVFRNGVGTPLAMGNVLNRFILPVLNRCATCKLPKGTRHVTADHDWKRDESVPRWRGWHGFRRVVATNLQHLGANVTTAQGALRHSDATITLRHYSKVVREDVRAMMERLGESVELNANPIRDTERTPEQPVSPQPESVN